MPVLNFIETHRYAYPVTTDGTGTALTTCLYSGDPMLAFLTQTRYEDEVVYLALGFDYEYTRHDTPPGRDIISGMGYNPNSREIWCGSTTSDSGLVFAFDPTTGLETQSLDLTADTSFSSPQGFATNGLLFTRSKGANIELRLMNGTKLAERSFPGRIINGISASPFSWTFVDSSTNEIVVIGPFGNEIATAATPGTNGGSSAIAFNTVANVANDPQVWLEPGIIGDPGTIHHPDTPWSPSPWMGRHRLYVANDTDQIIYAGYLSP